MRRKIIRQGKNSYTVTVPIQWVRDNNISEEDEVLLKSEHNKLTVLAPSAMKRRPKKITLHLKEYNERSIRNLLNQTYRNGYDEINLVYSSESQINEIDKILPTLLGFDSIDTSNTICTLQNIAEPSEKKFDPILRKIFLLILSESDELQRDFTLGLWNYQLRSKSVKNSVDTYTNYCRRVITEKNVRSKHQSYALFHLVSRLSLIHHAYYYLSKIALQKKPTISDDLIIHLKEVNDMVRLLYDAFYEPDFDKLHAIGKLKDELIYQKLYTLLETSSGFNNIMLYHLGEITRLAHLCSINIYSILVTSMQEKNK